MALDNFYSISIVVLTIILVFTPLAMIGDEVITNDNIDDDSKNMIISINYRIDQDFNRSDFQDETLNVSENSTFEGTDAFSRDFLESQAAAEKRTNTVQRITRIPDLIILSIGVPEKFVTEIKLIILTIIGVILSIATYNAVLNRRISRRDI